MPTGKIAIASDHAGFDLKETLKQDIVKLGYEVVDLGPANTQSVDYPDYATKVADWLKNQPLGMGVLICGSGIGMSMAANRHKHVRAALVHTGMEAKLSRQHNNANVLCMGARIIGSDIARDCLEQFVTTKFEGGRHEARVAKFSC